MCRKLPWCSELSQDPRLWDRHAPLTPPTWFADAARAFRFALAAAIEGDVSLANQRMTETRGSELQAWYIEHAQNAHRFRSARSGVLPAQPSDVKDSARYPRELYSDVMHRDSWHCRYCGMPVVDTGAQKVLHRLHPDLFPMGRTNLERHGIRLALTATMDHVDAHHTGGGSGIDNLVAACWSCNYGKGRRSLAELLLDDPRDRPPVRSEWDGGSGLI